MVKQFVLNLILSIIMVCVPAASVSYLLSPILPFWLSFFAISVLIWTSITLIKSIILSKKEAAEAELISKLDYEDERNTVLIGCPCQQNTFQMKVYPSGNNEYTCKVCKNKFYIDVNLVPTLQTEPLNLDNAYKVFEELVKKDPKDVDREL